MTTRPSLKEYSRAEARLRESIILRASGLPMHDYPGRREDLELIKRFHAEHGIPPSGFLPRLWWRVRGGSCHEHQR
jgi:hypothetical protein